MVCSAEEVLEAVKAGDLDRVRSAFAEAPDLAETKDGGLSLVLVALYHRHRDVAVAVADAKRYVDLFEASALGLAREVADLVGEDPLIVEAISADGFSPLHYAAFFGNPKTVRVLLQRKADPDRVADTPARLRPLHSAAAAGSAESVRLLLEHGATPDAPQLGGWTALHAAARAGNAEMAQALLEHGADPDRASDDGTTPRDLAAEAGSDEVATLLERGW